MWTQHTHFRFKEPHDVLLKNGDILLSAFPNGGGWSLRGDDKRSWSLFEAYRHAHHCDWIEDDEVVAIRLLTDEDIVERHLEWFTGANRIARINSYHAEGREHVIIPKNMLIKDHIVREFVNEIRDICVKYGATQQLRAHVSKLTKETFKSVLYKK